MHTQGVASVLLPVHILGGVLALVSGYVALFATKGATVHRRAGMLFVYAMVALSLTGALIALLDASPVSVVAGLLTFYFVTTALLTVRGRDTRSYSIDALGMMFALAIAVLGFKTGFELAGSGKPETGPMFIFGAVGLLAAVGDLRMIRADGISGRRRIARHLWRMCFAMWVAAASFFWGPRGRVPEIIYVPALLPIPVLVPVAVMLYWLLRLRVRKTLKGIIDSGVQQAPAPQRP